MTLSTNEFYGLASLLVVLIVLSIIAYLVWYYYWRRNHKSGFKILHSLPEKHQVVSEAPKIHLDSVEFTLPQPKTRPYTSYPEGYDDHRRLSSGNSSEKSSPPSEKSGSGVKTNVGLLKPELYNDNESDVDYDEELPHGNIGRIWFALEYDTESEKLIVNVEKIRHLPGRNQRGSISLTSGGNSCDPFIRLYLLPDEKRYLQSKMKRRTKNPTFNETFMFTMGYNLLIERTLRITVFDVDRFMRQSIIGHVLYPLNNINILSSESVFRDIEKSSQISGNEGRLQVGLSHFPKLNRVAVNVIRGQKIGNEEIIMPDSYVKVTFSILNKVQKTKKTSVQKNSSEPFYNQTLEFKVDSSSMEMACLNFDVYHSSNAMVKHDKFLGSFIIGGSMCTRGRELEHWTNMTQKPQVVVKEWHDLKM